MGGWDLKVSGPHCCSTYPRAQTQLRIYLGGSSWHLEVECQCHVGIPNRRWSPAKSGFGAQVWVSCFPLPVVSAILDLHSLSVKFKSLSLGDPSTLEAEGAGFATSEFNAHGDNSVRFCLKEIQHQINKMPVPDF